MDKAPRVIKNKPVVTESVPPKPKRLKRYLNLKPNWTNTQKFYLDINKYKQDHNVNPESPYELHAKAVDKDPAMYALFEHIYSSHVGLKTLL